MNLILKDGTYVPDGKGGFLTADGSRALLNDALFRLTCRRGAFPLLPDLGSRLYTLCREKPSARAMTARQYAAEALESMPVTVRDCTVTENIDGSLRVSVFLTAEDDNATMEVIVKWTQTRFMTACVPCFRKKAALP